MQSKPEDAEMDDLQFRRTIYANPHANDEQLKQAASQDPARQQFWNEMKSLENNIEQSVKVPVPDGLAQRLLLRQSMAQYQQHRQRQRWTLAVAASVLFTFGLSFTLWQHRDINLAEHALAHVYHEEGAMFVDEGLSLEQVNAKLASFGGRFTADIGKVYYANFCDFRSVKSLHMVLDTPQGKVTLFVVPHQDNFFLQEEFSDQQYEGRAMALQQASLILVGEQGQPLETLQESLRHKVQFSV